MAQTGTNAIEWAEKQGRTECLELLTGSRVFLGLFFLTPTRPAYMEGGLKGELGPKAAHKVFCRGFRVGLQFFLTALRGGSRWRERKEKGEENI